ncbi:hypothetical protein ECOK1357_5150 [Escherichia coli OK1357]|nr:hypothetical protein ECOK1357_5150 [Escherichia coli OK1357]
MTGRTGASLPADVKKRSCVMSGSGISGVTGAGDGEEKTACIGLPR